MKIQSLYVRDGLSVGRYEFGDTTVVFSQHNKAGKTTLLRCILYALGYPIPSMKDLDFAKMEFSIVVQSDSGVVMELRRFGAALELSHVGSQEIATYSLPSDQNEVHKILFGINDETVLDNLLGAFYLDQEKGWTLLNRGIVIGRIHFSIEDFLRGLIGQPCTTEVKRLVAVDKEIKKYQYMLNVARYKAELNDSGDAVPFDTPAEEITKEILCLRNERKPLENEVRRLRTAVKNNAEFKKYINKMQLRVQTEDGRTIPVTANNLVGFLDMSDFVRAKLATAESRIAKIDNQIDELEKRQSATEELVSVETSLQRFASELSRIRIDEASVERILKSLKDQKQLLHEKIRGILLKNRTAVDGLAKSIKEYLLEFGLDAKFGKDIFTKDLKSFSGTIFHLQVFAFTISYAKLVRELKGCKLPLIIDSPHGREVERDTVKKMMEILQRDFSDHQIIIATIYNPELPAQKTIELVDSVMHLGSPQDLSLQSIQQHPSRTPNSL